MKTAIRFLLALLVSLWCLCAAPEPSRADFVFGAMDGQGADPLVDPFPFWVFPNKTRTARIMFQSDDYQGVVTLQASCCTALTGEPFVPPGDVVVEAVSDTRWGYTYSLQRDPFSGARPPNLKSNQFVTRPHQMRTVGLRVTSTSGLLVWSGRFFAKVDAVKDDGTLASTQIIINVLPTLIDSSTPNCAAFTTASGSSNVASGTASAGTSLVPSDPVSPLAGSLFTQKVSHPLQTQMQFAYVLADGLQGQNMALSKSSFSLSRLQSMFAFHNMTFGDKQYVLFDSHSCTPTKTIQLKSGERDAFIADSTMMSTILFRYTDDGKTWVNVSIMSVGPFWTVFGGKEVDFEWINSNTNNVYGCSFC